MLHGGEPAFCLVPSPENNDRLISGILSITDTILRAEQFQAGLLIHGALAQTPLPRENGVLLAGPGHVGKTTASNRLPLPWNSLSDDATLVICDSSGRYWAHPWPTWSRFFSTPDGNPGSGGKWNVERRLPLQAIFFLVQAEKEWILPISFAPALAYLMETVQQVSWPLTMMMPINQAQALQQKQFAAAEKLLRSIPVFALHLSLTGSFWDNIEATLASYPPAPPEQFPDSPVRSADSECRATTAQSFHREAPVLTVRYSGSSMYPALRHPDLLEILPYNEQPVQTGDIVYFYSPAEERKVIHRVVRIKGNGIRTRGDNNPAADHFVIREQDVIGRVCAAWRHGKRRKIAGGFLGNCYGCSALLRQRTNKFLSPLLSRIYQGLATGALFRGLLPETCRPRVFEFKQRNLPSVLKLMINGRVIGHYDAWNGFWEIHRPWRLVIDTAKLPVVAQSPAMDILAPDNAALKEPEDRYPL